MPNRSMSQFKGNTAFGEASIKEQLEAGIISYLNWAFLGIGAFVNVYKDNAAYYGGDQSQLALVDEPNYTEGQVWQASRYDWVWESGIENDTQPIAISGVWVDGSFRTLNDPSGYAHYVDYPNGRVIFTSAISPSSIVEAEYSFRYTHTISVDQSPYMQLLQFDSLDYSNAQFQQTGSGMWDDSPYHTVQLPAIGVQLTTSSYKPYQIGGGQWQYYDVMFTIAAENSHDRDVICDILADQSDRHIYILETNDMASGNAFPINNLGQLQDNPIMYPDLIAEDSGYRYHKCMWRSTQKTDAIRLNQNLFIGRVRTTLELVRLSV
jgi:hypothetical protein